MTQRDAAFDAPFAPTLGLAPEAADSYAALGPTFATRLPAQPLPDPHVVSVSPMALDTLGLSPDLVADAAFAAALSGAEAKTPSQPAQGYATVYSGHQFGQWAGQLGDGRALGLGERFVATPAPARFEIQLKGAGLTPFSRMGDGRAVLRSSIREYLCSEAMYALGIPTTRALAVVGSALPVRRESLESAAVVTRFAPSFVRFGHFEHFWSTGQTDALRTLADHVIARFYPHLTTPARAGDDRDAGHARAGRNASGNPYAALLAEVVNRTAALMAQWQAIGFCHGVMNTDNMSILGLTLDYGPFGFLDGFDARHICNHTDQQGRYAYERQPQVAYWNLFCLAQALLPLIAYPDAAAADAARGSAAANGESNPAMDAGIETAKAILSTYKTVYADAFMSRMRAKLGLRETRDEDAALIEGLFQLMQDAGADFTLTFRCLATTLGKEAASSTQTDAAAGDATHQPVRDLFMDREAFDAWFRLYRDRLDSETGSAAAVRERAAAMLRVNPKYVLRNHLAEVAIRAAREQDFSETDRLLAVLSRPFDEQPENASYAGMPPDWAQTLEVSCSS